MEKSRLGLVNKVWPELVKNVSWYIQMAPRKVKKWIDERPVKNRWKERGGQQIIRRCLNY